MGCGGFTCSKNALAALNIIYILVAFILIGVAGVGMKEAIVTEVSVIGGIIACGIFLLLLAIIGLIGAIKHHQVLLFFYMVILFLLFIIQFAIACACLAVTEEQQLKLLREGWRLSNNQTKNQVQTTDECCGFSSNMWEPPKKEDQLEFPKCEKVSCCAGVDAWCCNQRNHTNTALCPCGTCYPKLKDVVAKGLKASGGIGLFFSFTEIVGVLLAGVYRNLRNPHANPADYLM